MSHRPNPHPHRECRGPDGRQPHPAARAQADWTLGHAGRQVRVGPVAFWTIVGTLVIMAGWSVVTATYFAFRDDVLTRLIARQAEMQYAYEDRIADLRGQVDRLASRQLLDQEQYERKLDHIIRRQATLESRASALSALPDPVTTGSIKAPRHPVPSVAAPQPAASPKPSPINDTIILVPPPEREARLESRVVAACAQGPGAEPMRGGIEGALVRLQVSLDRLETRQVSTLNALEETYDAKAKKMRAILADLGLEVGKIAPRAAPRASGGPFVPAAPQQLAGTFERQLYRINLVRAHVDKLTRTLGTVPIRRPLAGDVETTSNFGVRADPFLRAPAMHTGIDFRADMGEPARATASGTVTVAGWSGGYGRMVEIDHGNGLATRFGHLSKIDVEVGQAVKPGQIVGRVGSTGRSTGPHLHYETRVEGDPVDPQKFLRAGVRLGRPG